MRTIYTDEGKLILYFVRIKVTTDILVENITLPTVTYIIKGANAKTRYRADVNVKP